MKQTRNTQAKTEILKLIETSEVALSPAEILAILNGICDRVTIYRVLDRLTEEGIIHKIATVEGAIKYAICQNCTLEKHNHNHLHFTCERCQTTTCITAVEPSFTLPPTYKIKSVNFTISGICPECN
ncbi:MULTISPECIES: transcriptional repressor [Myroides]|uniref:Fur family transcriptional regulator n=1 Tax=Myroides odoratus TaxID=256 RepID=UPI000765B604|nr:MULTISPECIES: transcriptional repressor [Myroides]WHT39016.1 transcriptional repressor [Myroides sp. mNGS23_01]